MNRSSLAQPKFVIPALMVFAALFSIVFMLPQSLNLDEAQSLWQSAHTVKGIFFVVSQDVHVPFYHLLLHFWQTAFGNGVATARVLSLIFYLATIPLVYLLGKISLGARAALFGVIIFTLSPFTNWYGSIIRMYSLLALVTVVNQIFFVLLFKGDRAKEGRYWIGFFVSAFFGMYTHYFFFFVLIVDALFFFTYRRLFSPGAHRKVAVIIPVLAALFVPWLYYVHLNGGLGTNTSPKLLPPTTVNIANTFSNFLFGFQTNPVNTVILSLWPIATLFFMIALQRNRRVTPEATYFLTATFAPIAASAILSNVVTPFYLSRYFIGIFPSCALALSWFFELYPRAAAVATRTALASAMIVTLGVQTATANTISPIKQNYNGAAAYVAANATARDIIAVSTPFTIYPFEYYYNGPAIVTTLPSWNRLASGPIPAYSTSTLKTDIASFSSDHQYLYLVLSYDQGYEQQIRMYFDTHFERVATKQFSPDLTIYVYRLSYNNVSFSNVMAEIGSMNGAVGTSTKNSLL